LLNASVGVQRVIGRLRRPESQEPTPATTLHHRSRIAARQVRMRVDSAAATARLLPRGAHHRRTMALPSVALPSLPRPSLPTLAVLGRLGHERTVAVAVAGIVLAASVLSIAPGGAPSGDTGGPSGDGSAPRLAVGGTIDEDSPVGRVEAAYLDDINDPAAGDAPEPASNELPSTPPDAGDVEAETPDAGVEADPAVEAVEAVEGPFLSDGTLLKPVAVDTSVQDGSDLVRTYKVKSGDTLVDIAREHGVSMMTLWWANKLENKDDLHRGQVLKIPPVTGLVVKVKVGDTLATLAKEHKVTEDKILETNEIDDPNLVVGQVLILPGAKGEPIPTPKPTKKPTTSRGGGGSSGGSARPPKTYSGGNFAWPAPGGSISQYYHYGHYGLDIDGSTGDSIIAAASGTVTFAGWKSNGGGYQVWIAHGSGLYTTYNHMSSVSVGRGQHVSKGQRVGRMGATGYATGSHLHFEVWKGPIWNGGRRVNPLAYL
jgi:murein DD-endopeptidase MepM/ murein hydrolase activator NlpD